MSASWSFSRAYSHALRIAIPFPRFRACRITWAPARAAVSAVSSEEPSSITTTSDANCLAFKTTEPIVGPSLSARTATRILASVNARRKTAGIGVTSFLSMFLPTRQGDGRQGSRASLRAPHGGIPAIMVLLTFSRWDEKGNHHLPRFGDAQIESIPAFARCFSLRRPQLQVYENQT